MNYYFLRFMTYSDALVKFFLWRYILCNFYFISICTSQAQSDVYFMVEGSK